MAALRSPVPSPPARTNRSDAPVAAYLHVPFCPHVCPYCDFHKMRRNEGLVAAYLDRLEEEIAEAARRWPGPLRTIYLGGGTPSHLSDAELARVVAALRRGFGFPAAAETTLEADPLTFDAERLRTFRELGFGRLSIGLQSTQDEVLRFLGRQHDGRAGLAAVEAALDAGFEVSADLITAVAGQDAAADLEALAATGVPHVSVYTLTIEPYTPFGLRRVRVDEDRAADDYERAADVLGRYGYDRYEVSSHAKPGHEAVHNQVYWHGASFLGLGPSAAGFLPTDDGLGMRVHNGPIKAWLRGDAPLVERLSAEEHVLERLMTGLRTRRGVDLDALAARTGVDVRTRWADVLGEELAAGRLTLEATPPRAADRDGAAAATPAVLRATPDGVRLLNGVLRRFFAS